MGQVIRYMNNKDDFRLAYSSAQCDWNFTVLIGKIVFTHKYLDTSIPNPSNEYTHHMF